MRAKLRVATVPGSNCAEPTRAVLVILAPREGLDKLSNIAPTGACLAERQFNPGVDCYAVVLNPSGDVAAQQRDLLVQSTILMLIIIIPVMVTVVVFAWRYRHTNT